MTSELPADLIQFSGNGNIQRAGRYEWSSSCPYCGGEDRFRMFAKSERGNARYWCRVCGRRGFADEGGVEDIAEARARRMEWEARRAAERQEKIEKLQKDAYWRGWHDAMTATGRELWSSRGLPGDAQDWLELGYTDSPPAGGSPALTIPYHSDSWDVVNLQWRLIQPDETGKYRNTPGLPLGAYLTDPKPSSKNMLVVEGAIKSAVVWWRLSVVAGLDYYVVGIPSSTPSAEVMEHVSGMDYDRVYVMTDPDTYHGSSPPAKRVGGWFDEPLYVRLPAKPDDLLNEGWSARDLDAFIRQATYNV
jgi:hypothetical protein